MNEELHERIAKCLGWTVEETKQFSLQTLREMVRTKSSKLTYFIDEEIRSGRYLLGEPLKPRRPV
jgi:hypothetical protein